MVLVAAFIGFVTGCDLNGKLPFSVEQSTMIPPGSIVAFNTPSNSTAYVYGVKLDPDKLLKQSGIHEKSVLTGPWYIVCGAQFAGYSNGFVNAKVVTLGSMSIK